MLVEYWHEFCVAFREAFYQRTNSILRMRKTQPDTVQGESVLSVS